MLTTLFPKHRYGPIRKKTDLKGSTELLILVYLLISKNKLIKICHLIQVIYIIAIWLVDKIRETMKNVLKITLVFIYVTSSSTGTYVGNFSVFGKVAIKLFIHYFSFLIN